MTKRLRLLAFDCPQIVRIKMRFEQELTFIWTFSNYFRKIFRLNTALIILWCGIEKSKSKFRFLPQVEGTTSAISFDRVKPDKCLQLTEGGGGWPVATDRFFGSHATNKLILHEGNTLRLVCTCTTDSGTTIKI